MDSLNILHQKIIRIMVMAGTKRGASCRELLEKFNILPLARKYLLSLSFVMDNTKNFKQTWISTI
jgi:hypothetical protein